KPTGELRPRLNHIKTRPQKPPQSKTNPIFHRHKSNPTITIQITYPNPPTPPKLGSFGFVFAPCPALQTKPRPHQITVEQMRRLSVLIAIRLMHFLPNEPK